MVYRTLFRFDFFTPMSISNSTSAVTNTREWSDIRQPLYSTHIFSLAAYYQLGSITHRNGAKWDRQHIVLPLIFLFFPLLYPSQIIVATLLGVRNYIWRPNQGLKYYICAVLGMYALRSSLVDGAGNHDYPAKRRGYHLLLDIFKPRARPIDKPWSGTRVFSIILGVIFLYQAASTTILYVHRWATPGPTLLEIEHRIGLTAIGGFASCLGYLFFELTGYDWEDTLCTDRGPQLEHWQEGSLHKGNQLSHRHLADGLDTSNKHTYDCALAVCLHLLYLRLAGRDFPLFDRRARYRDDDTLLWSAAVPYIALAVLSVPMLAEAFWSAPTMRWYQRLPGGGFKSRICILLACVYVSTMTLLSECREIVEVNRGQVDEFNSLWNWEDPWTDFLWPL